MWFMDGPSRCTAFQWLHLHSINTAWHTPKFQIQSSRVYSDSHFYWNKEARLIKWNYLLATPPPWLLTSFMNGPFSKSPYNYSFKNPVNVLFTFFQSKSRQTFLIWSMAGWNDCCSWIRQCTSLDVYNFLGGVFLKGTIWLLSWFPGDGNKQRII